jgi:hypothetical protein
MLGEYEYLLHVFTGFNSSGYEKVIIPRCAPDVEQIGHC